MTLFFRLFDKHFFNSLFNSVKIQKMKSHTHHIIPEYIPKEIADYNFKANNMAYTFFILFDKSVSKVPFYFNLVASFSSLFLLFLIFLHKHPIITFASESSSFYLFFTYYFSLFFYIILLVHSVYKFLLHLFDEINSPFIYTKKVESQYILGITLFIASEIMLFVSFFWAFFHNSLSPSIFVGNC